MSSLKSPASGGCCHPSTASANRFASFFCLGVVTKVASRPARCSLFAKFGSYASATTLDIDIRNCEPISGLGRPVKSNDGCKERSFFSSTGGECVTLSVNFCMLVVARGYGLKGATEIE
jgi:hypothetical protein